MLEYLFKAVLIKDRRKILFIFVISCRDITSKAIIRLSQLCSMIFTLIICMLKNII